MKHAIASKRNPLYMAVGGVAICALLIIPIWWQQGHSQQEAVQEIVEIPEAEPQSEFATVYYYEEENEERYCAYREQYSDLAIEDIVWQVNAQMDKTFYDDALPVANPDAIPSIVNKYYYLAEDYVPADMEQLPSGKYATKETCEAYALMDEAAKEEGLKLYATSAYRSYDYQKSLYNKYVAQENGNVKHVDTYSARPGYSEHQTGRAIDLIGSFGSLRDFIDTPEGPWIYENCYQYGFIVRYLEENVQFTGYQSEPWHITYVGVDIATQMHELGIATLEEYMEKYVYHQPPMVEVQTASDEGQSASNQML